MGQSLAVLEDAGTAVIADVFDSLGITPFVLDNALRPVGQAASFAGSAYTIGGTAQTWTGGDREKLQAIDDMPEGVVAVWASNDTKGVCCFGDLLASAMRARGCRAAVVDGGVRDASFLQGCGMPVVARYLTPAQGIGRWKVNAVQSAVNVRGALADSVTVNPGDTVVGDADGVIVVPQDLLATVTTKVVEWSQSESGARRDIQNGLPLLAALAKYGHL